MSEPLVSVIIPAYKQADFLGEAIASVLEQSYANVEAIVVDDASPDHTAEVVNSFTDPRLRFIVHDRNRMLAAARNTGMRAAHGEIFALLDADDYFHRDKIAHHVAYLREHPDVGVTYNDRFDLQCGTQGIRNIFRSPTTVTLSDLVLGFPFSPSDMVLRREWAFAVDLFDESLVHFSEDLDINCRLALAGCRFAGIERALNYRRFHAGRVIRNTRERLEAALLVLRRIFADPRTPAEVRALQGRAFANNYIVWGVEALRNGDAASGNEFLHAAVENLPDVLTGCPNDITTFMLYYAISDDTWDHPLEYRRTAALLSDEFQPVLEQMPWAIARGWLVKAYRYLIWGPPEEGLRCLREAVRAEAVIDPQYVREVVFELRGYESEQGVVAADEAAERLDAALRTEWRNGGLPSIKGDLHLTRAFEHYYSGRTEAVPAQVLRAIRSDPRTLFNRGALAILARTAMQGRTGGS